MLAEAVGRPRIVSAAWLVAAASLLLCLLLLLGHHESSSDVSSESLRDQRTPAEDPSRPRAPRIAKYSKTSESDGVVFHVDRHFVRRRARRSVRSLRRTRGVRGVARECAHSCSLRLRSGDSVYLVHLHVWRQLPLPHNKSLHDLENGAVVPIVQYIEDEDSMQARVARLNPDCIYRARVDGSTETSIVNLCDSSGGLFGLLALPDGVYSVEPLHNGSDTSSAGRHAPHLVHKFRGHNFKQYDYDPVTTSTDNHTAYSEIMWEDLNERHARSRRSATSWDHYVEVFVVADSKMHEYHGRHLESYILTLFSTVASIYRHQTLRAAINIVVVKILILQHEYGGPRITTNAQESLQNFCRWQTTYNDRHDDSMNHYDVAILLTRKDICRGPGKCDTLGLAELGTMCDWEKSCAIIEDNGLSAAFTIAHEVGHLFNIPHDDERKCGDYMPLTKHNFHIMAPTLEYNTHPWSWSACSSAMLERFLERRQHLDCLFDQPIERRYYDEMFEQDAPGRKYDVHQQCKFVFGPHAELCPYMPSCRRLWCSIHYGVQMGCRTQHMPWADGTPCDKNGQMYCHRGECVGMSPERRLKQDGAWGEWQPWGQCSRTCGGGVQKAQRDCDSPKPTNGGKYCVGIRERYRSCNVQECPWDTPGFREVQCAEFNNKDVGIHGVARETQWVPKYEVADNERCKLYCRVSGISAFYMLKNKVTDGTPCDRHGDDICVDGACRRAGCDHVLDSPLKRDKCGICGGNDTGCRVVKGTYNERGSFGYNEVMKIPAGSANIDIRQHGYNGIKDDDNYLSLRSANGEFLLNGHYQVSVFRQQIPIQDVILEYSGSDHIVERINGTGPIRSDIYLHVLSVGNLHPPDIRYEYMTAVTTHRPTSGSGHYPRQDSYYFWRLADQWTTCSKLCQGEQRLEYICVDAHSNRQTSERSCLAHRQAPPPQTRKCNMECTLRWQVEDASRCNVQCGHGEKMLKVFCSRVDSNGRAVAATDRECEGQPRPSDRTVCYVDCTGRGGHWSYSAWTECTATCGQLGVSRRNAFCVDSQARQLDAAMCDGRSREQTERECNRVPCPRWSYGQWSECTKSCDGGIRRRHAMCLSSEDRELPPTRCSQALRNDYEKCNEQECTWWEFGQWSECSAACGRGNRTRKAFCKTRNGPVDDARCDVRERIVSKECDASKSCPHWHSGEWTSCENRCGEQWSTRRVVCVDAEGRTLKDHECTRIAGRKPDTHRECPNEPCPFWRSSDWGPCSVSCGKGVRSRRVECLHREDVVDDSFCGGTKPNLLEDCTLLECSQWSPSAWSPCSVSCGTGNQTRTVHCERSGKRADATECDQKTRPRMWKHCIRDKCVAVGQLPQALAEPAEPRFWWATGSWTECSTSCGKGTQRRLVKCRDKIRDLPELYCQHLEKVEMERECQTRPCTRWTEGEWKPCPASCGERVYQERDILCVSLDSNATLPAADCDIAHRPAQTRDCHLPRCPRADPPMGVWITQPWSKCAVSCGGGWRTRAVSCSTSVCDVRRRPVDVDRCGQQACPSAANRTVYSWQIPPWTHCSVTCGSGVQTRSVWCEEDAKRNRAADTMCTEARPSESKACHLSPCPAVTHEESNDTRWSAGPWSACSAACGKGVRRRVVLCLDASDRTLPDARCGGDRPIAEHRCRFKHCPRWRGQPWGQCSSTCGEGVRRRKVVCQRGRKKQVPEEECAQLPKRPPALAKCFNLPCPVYNWTVSPWSKCIDPCSGGEQSRVVHCMNSADAKAADRMCARTARPLERRACPTDQCPYEWVPGPWNSCSKTCGNGTQFRVVECRLKASFSMTLADLSKLKFMSKPNHVEPVVPKEKCQFLDQPDAYQDCLVNICRADFRWQLEPWGECSTTCGAGVRRRRVRCVDRRGERKEKEHCEALTARPNRTQSCFARNCLPSTCQEIKAQHTTTHSVDGEYTVLLDGFAIRVHCHRMNETIPRAYISVKPDTNYAEVYGKRLIYPHTCPHNGERNDSCQCTEDGSASAGMSRFNKIRVDLLNRRININDFTFAHTPFGLPVAYATAGDCYSMKDCPQGRFSMDLRGTGIRIVDDLQWEDRGHRTTSRIDRTHNNARIEGQCGGYCGKCAPDKYKGLVFEIDPQQGVHPGRK